MIETTQTWKIGDCVELMREMPDECVDLVVTSPPYDNLRTYGGYNFDFEKTAEQLYRVVKTGGVVVWVVGDQTIDGSETGTSLRQALHFKDIGFNLHDTMIWIKDGGGAIGSNKAYTQNFEYMFVFSKGDITTYNLIRDKTNKSFGVNKNGGRRKKNGEHKIDRYQSNHKFSKRNNYWKYNVGKGSSNDKVAFKHPAIFPEQLAKDHIISWSNEGDLVLDPFCGSGTVLKMCRLTNRNGIGFEINPDYEPIIRDRCMAHTPPLQSYF